MELDSIVSLRILLNSYKYTLICNIESCLEHVESYDDTFIRVNLLTIGSIKNQIENLDNIYNNFFKVV